MTHLLKTAAAIAAATTLLAGCRDAGAIDIAELELMEEPPIWSVTDGDSEVILYPTVHILPEGVEWQSERLDAAIARAGENGGEVWYELPASAMEDPAMAQLVMELGLSDEPLSARLPEPTLAKMNGVMGGMGIPEGAFDQMQPWLAALSLTNLQYMQAGYSGEAGVETSLQRRDDVAALGQRALETPEQQLRFFADLSEDKQVMFLDQTLEDLDEGVSMLDTLATAWATGDADTLQTEFIDGMSEYPELYDTLIVRRNADWAEQLDAEMQGSGVDFVAVGAGHLVGPDSLPAMMAAKGYDVTVLTVK